MAEERGESRWEQLPRWAQIMVIAGAAVAFVLVWWLVPPLLYAGASGEAVRVKAITDTRTAFLAGLVGVGALGTFWLNSRTTKITAQTFAVTERGHVTDRYATATRMLGSESLDVRLAGVYALEQIAKDTFRVEEDRPTIVAVLSAFVRVHSDPVHQFKDAYPDKALMSDERLAIEVPDYMKKCTKPPEDIQAAVTVLGRLRYLKSVPRANLTGATLRFISLTYMTGADLTGADLTGADLTGADLTGANLTDVLWPKDAAAPAGWQRATGSGRLKLADSSSGGQ